MKCKKCGEEIPENSKFCTKCGAKTEDENIEEKVEELTEEKITEEQIETKEISQESKIDEIKIEEQKVEEDEKKEEVIEKENNDKFKVKQQENSKKKKSKIKVIIIVFILILAILAGVLYVFKDELEIFDEKDKETNNTKKAVENTISEMENETNDIEDDEKPSKTLVTTDKREFKNGLAWSKVDGQYVCINTEGKVVFRLQNEYDTVTDFTNPDYALVSNYYNKAIIDKEGNMVTTDKDNSAFDKIVSDDVTAGYAVVSKQIDTYEVKETRYGIIGFEGNWILELSTDNSFLKEYKQGLTKNILTNNENLYFVDTAKKVKLKERIYKYIYDDDENCYFYTVGSKITKVNKKTGKTKDIIDNITYCGEYSVSDGLIYISTSKWDKKKTIVTSGFYDLNGKKQYDVKEKIVEVTESINGFAGIVMQNNGGTSFGTVIDKEGNHQFEPIKGIKKLECIGENKFFISYSNEDGEGSYVCNEKGEKIFDATNMTKYTDGYSVKDDTNYVDENGIILSIIEE